MDMQGVGAALKETMKEDAEMFVVGAALHAQAVLTEFCLESATEKVA